MNLIFSKGADVAVCCGIQKEHCQYLTWKKAPAYDSCDRDQSVQAMIPPLRALDKSAGFLYRPFCSLVLKILDISDLELIPFFSEDAKRNQT